MAAGVPVPELPSINQTGLIDSFTSWWDSHTFNIFTGIIAALFIFSVFLKTRSLSATLVAAIAAEVVVKRSWILLVISLLLAGLVWGAWQRSE